MPQLSSPAEHLVFRTIRSYSPVPTRMLKIFKAAAPLTLLLVCTLTSQKAPAQTPTQTRTQTWTLQWSDEFNAPAGTYPNPANWTYDTGNGGFGNPEIENYCLPGSGTAPCKAGRPNAFQDGEGNLVLTAMRNPNGQWTSARLKTQGLQQFQYGRIEARMRLPVGDGFWPAFWMLGADIESHPWPACGEQDIVEWVQSYTPATSSSTTHGPGYSADKGIGARFTYPHGGRVDDPGFHIYGVIWGPNSLQYYRDNPAKIFKTVTSSTLPAGSTWVFNHPFFVLLNLAIGSGDFPGPTDKSTPPTATMLVDYVRVYQLSPPKP